MSRPDGEPSETATRRKRVVGLLDGLETPVTVDQLVDELDSAPPPGLERPGRATAWEARHARLHDEDLPALDRAGLVAFDAERGLVSRRGEGPVGPVPTGGDVATDRADERGTTDRFARCFLGFGVVSLALLGATTLDVGAFARAPDGVVSTGLVLVFGLLSVVSAVLQ